MALLRASSSVNHLDTDATRPGVGVPHGDLLAAFATAAVTGDGLPDARAALLAAVGADGVVEAAATVSAFEGLNRVADATGIELDDGLNAVSIDLRTAMELDAFAGAANTSRVVTPTERDRPDAMPDWGGRRA